MDCLGNLSRGDGWEEAGPSLLRPFPCMAIQMEIKLMKYCQCCWLVRLNFPIWWGQTLRPCKVFKILVQHRQYFVQCTKCRWASHPTLRWRRLSYRKKRSFCNPLIRAPPSFFFPSQRQRKLALEFDSAATADRRAAAGIRRAFLSEIFPHDLAMVWARVEVNAAGESGMRMSRCWSGGCRSAGACVCVIGQARRSGWAEEEDGQDEEEEKEEQGVRE